MPKYYGRVEPVVQVTGDNVDIMYKLNVFTRRGEDFHDIEINIPHSSPYYTDKYKAKKVLVEALELLNETGN